MSVLAACSFRPPGGAAIDAASQGTEPGAMIDAPGEKDGAAIQMTMDFPVTQDTDVDAQAPDSPNGSRTTMLARTSATPCVALFRVELAAIATTATIDAAELHLTTGQTNGDPVSVFGMLEAWDEATATFNHRLPTIVWSGPGVTPPSREMTAAAGPIDTSQQLAPRVAAVDTALVTRWVAHPEQNFGAAIVMPTTSSATFRTRDDPDPSQRPFLRVTFTQ
jgi:hypothetical protein